MRKSYIAAIAASVAFAGFTTVTAQPAQAQEAAVKVGKMIYSADGKRLGSVYRLTKDGAPQIIISGKMVTIPAASLSKTDEDRAVTSLTKKEVVSKR